VSNDDYIKNRLEDQMNWHAAKARSNKERFRIYQFIVIIAGGLIPFLNTASYLPEQIRIISSLLGTIVAILTAINQFEKYETAWNENRTIAERLKREKVFFKYNTGYYSYVKEEDRNKFLIERVEDDILASR
jgi:uncharacterized protein DUF4231